MLHRWLNSIILRPDRYCYQIPEDVGLCASPVAFPNGQGQLLRGFLFAPLEPEAASHLPSRAVPTVLFCPGTAGNLSSHLYYVELLCRAGCRVLSIDYTGFGQSAGQASLETLVADVLGASDFLQREQHVEAMGIFGLSLGANVALMAAAQQPAIRAAAVEGLALYQDITYGVLTDGVMGHHDVTTLLYEDRPPVRRRLDVVNRHFVPAWLARALAGGGMRLFPCPAKDPLTSVALLRDTAVFCMHGVEDSLLPFEGTLQVYNALPGRKDLWLIPEVSHPQEAALAQDGEYVAQLADFFHATLTDHTPRQATTMTLEVGHLRNTGAAGLALTTIMADHTLACRTTWVEAAAHCALAGFESPGLLSGRRLFAVEGRGATAQPRLTPRGQQYRRLWQPLMRDLGQLLHERRVHDMEPVLRRLPSARPEPPFDFFLGLYCVDVMKRAQRTLPHLASMAAQAFLRYWHYGPATASPGTPTLRDLACTIVGRNAAHAQDR